MLTVRPYHIIFLVCLYSTLKTSIKFLRPSLVKAIIKDSYLDMLEFVLGELSKVTHEAILSCRFNNDGVVAAAIASRIGTDGLAITQAF